MTFVPTEKERASDEVDTNKRDGDAYVDCLYYGKPLMANREVNGECFYESDDEWGDVVYEKREITAWMPLPEPYHNDEPQTDCSWK